MTDETFYAAQSAVTDPGELAQWLDSMPPELAAIQRASCQLVLHYRSDGPAERAIVKPRVDEIDTRYADRMLKRLRELGDQSLTAARPAEQRLIGCCRDFTVLFLAMARHHGIPARARVGFAAYFIPGWNIDHVVAEVWDAGAQRWRLVEAEVEPGYVDPGTGAAFDPLDVPRDRFLTGAHAWLACRHGDADPERFVVAPQLDIPDLRGWPYLLHNLMHDLATLNKREMLLWDVWGLMERPTPPEPEQLAALDRLAEQMLADDTTTMTLAGLYDHDDFRVPSTVTSFSPMTGEPRRVTLTR